MPNSRIESSAQLQGLVLHSRRQKVLRLIELMEIANCGGISSRETHHTQAEQHK